jgi:enterochelin esterase-like enzyme
LKYIKWFTPFCIVTLFLGCSDPSNTGKIDDPLELLADIRENIHNDPESVTLEKVQQLKSLINRYGTPLVRGDEATFIVYTDSSAESVKVLGIFSKDSGDVVLKLDRLGDLNIWSGSYRIPSNAEFIYNIDIDGKITEDGLCKRWLLGFGKHSVGRMPEFDPWVDRALTANPPRGEMHSFTIKPEKLEGKRTIKVYLPPGYKESDPGYHTLYIHDGEQAIVDGKLPQIVDYLLADQKIRPLILCFVTPRVRMSEYGDEDKIYADFLVNEVVPEVDVRFRTISQARARGVTGASMGGRISTYLVLHHNDVFQNCISQSAYFEAHSSILENLKTGPKLPVNFYLDVGIFEGEVGRRNLVELNRDLYDLLREKGYRVIYREWPGGHCWLTWSRGIGEALPLLWNAED